MPSVQGPQLVSTNAQPFELRTRERPPSLQVIDGSANTVLLQKNSDAAPDIPDTLATLQALLGAEAHLLETLRGVVPDRCRRSCCPEALCRDLNNENVFHIARFFYLLSVLRCTTAEAVGRFIDSHNQKISSMLDAQDFRLRTERELKKAFFSKRRKFVLTETVRERMRPVFAKSELADFLFDHMSRDTAVRTIDLLCDCGLLLEIDDDPLEGSNRRLIMTDGTLENAYHGYLKHIQDKLSQ